MGFDFESPSRPIVDNRPSYMEDDPRMQMTPEEEEKVEKVFQAYKESKKFKSTFDRNWDKFEKLYSGVHWEGPRAEWKSTPVVNYCFTVVETIVPIMTDSNPTIMIAPQESDDSNTAEIIGQCVKRILVNNRAQKKFTQTVRNSLVLGTSFMKVWWNRSACGGKGDVEISVVDPRHCFPSPGALDIQEAAYFIYATNVPINYIEEMYPDAKGKIKPGVWEEDLTVEKNNVSQGGGGSGIVVGPVQSTDSAGTGAGSSTSWASDAGNAVKGSMERSKLATLIEMWHKKDGKVWCTVAANKVLLHDNESPFKHNRYPFAKLVDYDIPSSFWGMGEIQQLEKLQDFINKRRGQTQDILKICASPPLIADSNSGINPKAMVARPGTIIYKNQGTDVHWMQPPNLPAALFDVQQLDKQDFDAISGVFDVTQGRKPSGIEAAAAIVELQDAAQTRIRLKVRNLETFLQELGELIVPTMQQFYTSERVVRLVGGNPMQPEFVVVNKMVVDKTGKAVKINDVTTGEYDIEIGVGSTMPVNKARYYTQMKEMFELGIVDDQAVIESSILPPPEVSRILQRKRQKEQELMMLEQGMAPPPSGGAAPMGPSGPAPSGPPSGPSEEELRMIENG